MQEMVSETDGLQRLDDWLSRMMARLLSLLEAPFTQKTLVEVTAIYNNVAYLFLYLEANDALAIYESLLPWKGAFHDDLELRHRVLSRLGALHCDDSDAEESRLAYISQLQRTDRAESVGYDAALQELRARAEAAIHQLRTSERELLARLGMPEDTNRPAVVFYRLLSQTPSRSVRQKLEDAWGGRRADGLRDLAIVVDQMVGLRRRRGLALGYDRVTDETFERCSVDQSAIDRFLDIYVARALEGHKKLTAKVAEACGARDEAMREFGCYIRRVIGHEAVQRFSLDRCLSFAFSVAGAAFGLTFEMASSSIEANIRSASVFAASRRIGEIHFDLWGSGGRAPGNHTQGLRNRTDWPGLEQLPVAHVFCAFRRTHAGTPTLTFQNVHSLFHEFGHAINHLMIKKRISNRSGLEYLPLERLECLSMWFERWVYHPDFVAALGDGSRQREGIRRCQRIKALEHQRTQLERGMVATLDFWLHRSCTGRVLDLAENLRRKFDVGDCWNPEESLEYFTWPMFQAHPGANFAYLLGAADSATNFRRFERLSLREVAQRDLSELFAPYLDFSQASAVPNVSDLFDFYERMAEPQGAA